MIEAVIFDFDGLLVDTETPAFESWQRIYAEYGHELPLETWKEALGTMHGFDALVHLATLVTIDQAVIAARRQELKEELSRNQPLLPGVRTILDEAHRLGLPCAIASSSGRAWIDMWLARHQLVNDFVCIRTADDVSQTKPAPDLFLSAADGLGVVPDACLVFEDSPNGLLAARAAGMRVVAIPGAISSQIVLPPSDLSLTSLDALPLSEIIARVSA